MDIKSISLQIYTARYFKPYENILKFLSEVGMNKVELFEVETFIEIKQTLDKYNMVSPSAHIGYTNLEDTNAIIDILKKSNISNAIVPAPAGKSGGKFSF